MWPIGKGLVLLGIFLIVLGILLGISSKWPIPLGRLPGDIWIQKERFVFFFPIATCLLISLILTIVFHIFLRR